MTPLRDYNNEWTIHGHESIRFSSEADARAAIALAKAYDGLQMLQEARFRHAAANAKAQREARFPEVTA